ncbi:MAG: 4-alpha-glucanotransferase [Coriobacteriia bacterium]|nr:4-alpha-glucanotransferase [Coriobacteriia bacterium]
MKAFHDSRDIRYRTPYGAITPGDTVLLRLDVWDAPGAHVALRTWVDGVGEALYDMAPIEAGADGLPAGATRYEAALTPEETGGIWYHFVITQPDGFCLRYGALDGRYGGAGQMRDWEPPSFLLTVYDPNELDRIVKEIFDGTNLIMRPPAEMMVGFLRNETTAREFVEALKTLRENCAPEAFQRSLNLLGSYKQSQLFALLAGAPASEAAMLTPPVNYHLDPSKGGLAKGRLWAAALLQMLSSKNPIARTDDLLRPTGTLLHTEIVEGHEDADCEVIVENALDIHRTLPSLFEAGSVEGFAINDDVFGVWRRGEDGTAVCLLVNASLRTAYDVPVPMVAEYVSDVLSGYGVRVVDAAEAGKLPSDIPTASRYALMHLYQLGTAILYFHPKQRLQREMPAGVGVLEHITSLPMDNGKPEEAPEPEVKAPAIAETTEQVDEIDTEDEEDVVVAMPENPGTLGASAFAFVDWLAQAGVRYWQVLPVNPTDEYGSPYAGISAFAGNVRLLEGDLDDFNDYDDYDDMPEYQEFCQREADWLEPYAAFMAIRDHVGKGIPWQEWPERYRTFKPDVLGKGKKLPARAEKWRRAQFEFECQWKELRAYANERGVQIVGDMPIYVSADSSDVWANPDIFQLDADGNPTSVAGCPPDAFAVEGQIWGNPVYDWAALAESGYAWWLRRLERAFDLYDIVRLDHFIGFSRYYSIPIGEKATKGTYYPGPGMDFFNAAYAKFGPLPLIAEDLGMITPAVRTLVAACGFPGMDIVQFVDGNDPLSGYQPRPEKIAYTGTHDNQTLVGYAQARYADQDAQEVAAKLMQGVASCNAPVVVFPLQDLLGLDDKARMNIPGTSKGNWIWQAKRNDVEAALETTRELVNLHK